MVVVVVVVVAGVDLGVETTVFEDVLLEEVDVDVGTLVAMISSKAVACTSQFSTVPRVVSISDEPPSV